MTEHERRLIRSLGLGDDKEWMKFGGIAYPAIRRKVEQFGIDPDRVDDLTSEIMVRLVLILREMATGQKPSP